MNRQIEVAALYGRRYFSFIALGLLLILALLLRIADLGSTPSNLTADELDDLQNAYRVIYGKAGGFFGLDWNQSPNLNMYLKAAAIRVFGDSVAGTRMYSVVLSLASLALFYPLARRRLDVLPSLLTLFLLATSLWFLHFSRTPWVAMSAVLAAVATAYLLDLAIERRQVWLFALAGAAVAFGAYGYFAGRTLAVVVIACYGLTLLLGERDPKSLFKGFVVSGVVAFVLFAPQLKTLLENWEYANRRPNAVSVFRIEGAYLGDSSRSQILLHQTLRTARGFLLLDKSVTQYGLWARHHPPDLAFLDQLTGVVYWAGLATGVLQWRRYAYWWAFLLLPLFFTQVFSVGTPDGSRALIAAPFMFLFTGVGLQTLLGLARGPDAAKRLVPVAVVVVVAFVGAYNVDRYFDWMKEPGAIEARKPAIAAEEFKYFREIARDFSSQGRLVSEADWLQYRQQRLESAARPP